MSDDSSQSDADETDDGEGERRDVPPGDDPPETRADRGRVLSPNELDITDDEAVEELDEGRYVVSPGGGPPNVPDDPSAADVGAGGESEDSTSRDPGGTSDPGGLQSPEAARNLLDEELSRTRARYGIDVVGRFDGDAARHRTVSNDVVATFENLVLWYARHVSDDTPAEEVIDILLREASVVPDPGTPNLAELLERHDLSTDDSIAELVAAITRESGD